VSRVVVVPTASVTAHPSLLASPTTPSAPRAPTIAASAEAVKLRVDHHVTASPTPTPHGPLSAPTYAHRVHSRRLHPTSSDTKPSQRAGCPRVSHVGARVRVSHPSSISAKDSIDGTCGSAASGAAACVGALQPYSCPPLPSAASRRTCNFLCAIGRLVCICPHRHMRSEIGSGLKVMVMFRSPPTRQIHQGRGVEAGESGSSRGWT
jgi:hypothetical protein